ncbi:hypothetical protein HY991_04850 [Candidatus Micrarchaeota archaeon]|nr:hypothetical protein [Candidatus Micrarchaeota archaeon]
MESVSCVLDSKGIFYEARGKNIKIPLQPNGIKIKELKAALLAAGFSISKPSKSDDFILFSDERKVHIATLVGQETLLLHEPAKHASAMKFGETISALKSF